MIEKKIFGNVLYGQSGGPTSVINASAFGLINAALKNENIEKVYAMRYGISGILSDNLLEIKNDKNLKKLLNTPGAVFGSNRYKLDDFSKNTADFQQILKIFQKYNIKYFFYNGGNDSMDTINKISKYLELNDYKCNCIGINKTIDNDLMNTHFSLGFASSAKFIINSVIEVYLDDHSYKKGRVNIIETMGRNAGFLAASSIVTKVKGCSPDLIYVPEDVFDIEDFLNQVEKIYLEKGHCLVVISEGIRNKEGKLFFETNENFDVFGHKQLGGAAVKLSTVVEDRLNFPVRYIELSLLQRANSMFLSKTEVDLAIKLSEFAFNKALEGESNKVATIEYKNKKFSFNLFPIDSIANKERKLDLEYIDTKKHIIKDSYIDYILPLIGGEDGLIDVYKCD